MTDQQWRATCRNRGRGGGVCRGLYAGRGRTRGCQEKFQGCDVGGAAVWGGDVGTDPEDGVGSGELPARVRTPDHQ